ncbi:squalene epoxidase [Lasiosphaeria hispida]|uniref:Squalene monooxygenase n=1 Tax=Lasiosphaeria hispida TaxID=260671 RepID=A0AAJ0HLA6_9PEZI|nr:squalene epoxidase [Lasiosphaeria hispida]
MEKRTNYDVIVIGAGIAGSAAAVAFSRQGRQVLLVERNLKEPDRIVGELLQPGGVDALSELGLVDCLEGIDATPINGYHLYWKDEEASFWFCEREGRKRKPQGSSFHHGKFVTKLRQAASAQSNTTVIESTVMEILRDGTSSHVTGILCSSSGQMDEQQFFAPLTILADGSTSNFRSQFTPHRPKSQSRFWGLELVDAKLPIPQYAHAVLGRGPPILMYPISSHQTRILIDIPDTVYDKLGNLAAVREYLQDHVAPIVPESVQPQLLAALRDGRLRSMPNAWLPSTKNTTPGLVILGDASNMRHPVTGSGMTVALKDAVLLAKTLNPDHVPDLEDTAKVLKKLGGFHWSRKEHSASLNMLAQALYFLFVPEDKGLQIMQRGFIQYVQDGEKNFAEPAWIMGGLPVSPFRLFYHFFAIALYSIHLHLRREGFMGLGHALFQSASVLVSAICIIWGPLVNELRR